MTARFSAALVALVIVVLSALEVPLGVNYARQREADLLVTTERDALGLGDSVEDLLEEVSATDSADPAAVDALAAEIGTRVEDYRDTTGGRVLVVDAAGLALADTDPPPDAGDPVGRDFSTRPEIAQALAGTTSTGSRVSETLGGGLIYAVTPVRSGTRILGAIRISHSRAEVDDDIAAYWWRLAGVAGITMLVAGTVGLFLGRWVTRPIRGLQLQTRSFGAGELEARADEDHGPPEVRELAAQFNRTAARLASSLRTTSQFAADAAHQLRTPLTALRLQLDNLRAAPDGRPEADRHERLDRFDDELRRMDRTIDVLLALAQLDERPPVPDDIDLADVARAAAGTWREVLADSGLTLTTPDHGPVMAEADPAHLEQILDNLLANALAIVPTDTTVEVHARIGPDGPELAVIDHGPGIDPAVRAQARQRHWHNRAGGTGLGLAIVDRLCQHNGAELHLDDTPGGGLTARITFSGGG